MLLAQAASQAVIQLASSGVALSNTNMELSDETRQLPRSVKLLRPRFEDENDRRALRTLARLVQASMVDADAVLSAALASKETAHHVWIKCAADIHGVGGPCRPLDEGQEMDACSGASRGSLGLEAVVHAHSIWSSSLPAVHDPEILQ